MKNRKKKQNLPYVEDNLVHWLIIDFLFTIGVNWMYYIFWTKINNIFFFGKLSQANMFCIYIYNMALCWSFSVQYIMMYIDSMYLPILWRWNSVWNVSTLYRAKVSFMYNCINYVYRQAIGIYGRAQNRAFRYEYATELYSIVADRYNLYKKKWIYIYPVMSKKAQLNYLYTFIYLSNCLFVRHFFQILTGPGTE